MPYGSEYDGDNDYNDYNIARVVCFCEFCSLDYNHRLKSLLFFKSILMIL